MVFFWQQILCKKCYFQGGMASIGKQFDIFKGRAALNVPDIIAKGKTRKVYAEIAYPNTPLTFTVDEDVISIDMTDIMSCFLYGEDFEIVNLSPEDQVTLLDRSTIWSWNITPLKKGLLQLNVSI